jgi:hypothetical protein
MAPPVNAAGDHVRLIDDLVFSNVSSVKLMGASGVVVITAPLPSFETNEFP